MKGKQTERNKAGKILTCTAGKTYPCGKSCFSLDRLCFQKGGYQARKKALQLAEYLEKTFLKESNEEENNTEESPDTVNQSNNKKEELTFKYKEDLVLKVDFNSPIADTIIPDDSPIKEIKNTFDSLFKELQTINTNIGNISNQEDYNNYYNQVKSVYERINTIRESLKNIDVTRITDEGEFKTLTFINNIPTLPLPGYKLQNVNLNKIKETVGQSEC